MTEAENIVRVDYRRRRAWLTAEAYEEALSKSTRRESLPPLWRGEIGSFNSVILHEVEPDALPPLGGSIVETDVKGLLFFVEWIATGKPMMNPLAPRPDGTGEAIKAR